MNFKYLLTAIISFIFISGNSPAQVTKAKISQLAFMTGT